MNIPKGQLVRILQVVCETLNSSYSASRVYQAQVHVVSELFSIRPNLITANISNIIAENKKEDWGEILFKCLKDHQRELGIDYD